MNGRASHLSGVRSGVTPMLNCVLKMKSIALQPSRNAPVAIKENKQDVICLGNERLNKHENRRISLMS